MPDAASHPPSLDRPAGAALPRFARPERVWPERIAISDSAVLEIRPPLAFRRRERADIFLEARAASLP